MHKDNGEKMIHIPFYRTDEEKRMLWEELRAERAKDITPRHKQSEKEEE